MPHPYVLQHFQILEKKQTIDSSHRLLFFTVSCQEEVLKWCTTTANEQEKCEEMAHFVDLQFSQFGKVAMVVKCIRVSLLTFQFLNELS